MLLVVWTLKWPKVCIFSKFNLGITLDFLLAYSKYLACSYLVWLVYTSLSTRAPARINIRMRSIIIIIYLKLFSSIKYCNTYSKIYIYHYLITIDFILYHTSMYSIPICLWIGILISSIIHEYIMTYMVSSIFI